MKWEGNRESENEEDRRDGSGSGSGGFSVGGGSLGIGSIVIALVGSYFFGVSPTTILNLLSGGSGPAFVVRFSPGGYPARQGVHRCDANHRPHT